jgi:hypothetical protein
LLEAIEPIIGARASGIRRVEASRGDCQGGAHTPIYQRTRFEYRPVGAPTPRL